MLKHHLFQQALPVLEQIEKAGFEAYFVGGCVRDALLGKDISDVDIATSAFPQEVKHIFKKTVDVGIEHGTVMVLFNDNTYEVTTFRTESTYQDFRRPDKVEFVRSLEEDLKRRDFTINALAMDRRGHLYDFHNGQVDLHHQCIRAVGCAHERFHEDALRMMRAVRFAGQLGFEIDDKTQEGIQKNAHLLKKIAVERIQVEWEKLMMSSFKKNGIDIFLKTGLYRYCPEFAEHKDALQRLGNDVFVLETDAMYWAILLYYMGIKDTDAKQVLKSWKLSNQLIDDVSILLRILFFRKERDWTVDDLFQIGKRLSVQGETLAYLLCLTSEKTEVADLYDALPIKTVKDLALNGKEIMALLQKETGGKYLGELIEKIRVNVLHSVLENDKEELTRFVKENRE
ncbi:CCA tRNA nucleotidyltransferase [Carnobacteriaceae bacterium zg-ZUI78]|nr:CCA tRNA nucleotidyltransferase [Carnobacteriaceae bacterium zg-ZUI78]